jgi:hypothetical protein
VTKAKAIEILNEAYDGFLIAEKVCSDAFKDEITDRKIALLTAIDVLKQNPTVEAEHDKGWISVKDRPLENQYDVLVCDVRGNVFAAYYFPYVYEWRYAFTVEPCKYEITHWRPLPEPPESEVDVK